MSALKCLLINLIVCIGLTPFAQPGSYYPPPGNVEFHSDTLTICPPDSLPGPPVVLLCYNIYIDSVFYDNVQVSDPADTIDFIFSQPALPLGDHAFCVTSVYNQWISDYACDMATVIYGYELPFLEDWSSVSFDEQQWISSSGNWIMDTVEGNPAPSAEFRGDPVQNDYAINLESFPINALGINRGKIWLDFYLKLESLQPAGNEKMRIQVWNWESNAWATVAEYSNEYGSYTWESTHIDIKNNAMDKVFKVRFQATGINSADILGWYLDNIHIYRSCDDGASNLNLLEFLDHNELSWDPPNGCYYDPLIHWDDGSSFGFLLVIPYLPSEYNVAARWDPDMLIDYAGLSVSKIAFNPWLEGANYRVRIWTGEGANTMVADQEVIDPVIGQWNYVTLTAPVTIDITQDLWVGYYIYNAEDWIVNGFDDGPSIDGYGNLINEGWGWYTLLQVNPEADYNWNIAFMLGYDPAVPDVYFNIYRETNNEEFQFYDIANDIEYLDTNIVLSDYYCYKVTTVWLKNGDTCESAPADSTCESIIVGTDKPEIDKDIRVFPNPVKNFLNIESDEEIRFVKLYNLLGETILEREVNQAVYKLDVNNFRDGIYYLAVDTGKREFKEKIVILK